MPDTPVQPIPTPPVAPTPVPQSPLKNQINKIRPWYNNLSPVNKKLVLAMAILLSIVFVLFVLALLFGPRKKVTPIATPTPVSSSAPTPSPADIGIPSRYATDSGVLKIETELKDIETKLNQTKLKDPDLLPPSLDYNINFTK